MTVSAFQLLSRFVRDSTPKGAMIPEQVRAASQVFQTFAISFHVNLFDVIARSDQARFAFVTQLLSELSQNPDSALNNGRLRLFNVLVPRLRTVANIKSFVFAALYPQPPIVQGLNPTLRFWHNIEDMFNLINHMPPQDETQLAGLMKFLSSLGKFLFSQTHIIFAMLAPRYQSLSYWVFAELGQNGPTQVLLHFSKFYSASIRFANLVLDSTLLRLKLFAASSGAARLLTPNGHLFQPLLVSVSIIAGTTYWHLNCCCCFLLLS